LVKMVGARPGGCYPTAVIESNAGAGPDRTAALRGCINRVFSNEIRLILLYS